MSATAPDALGFVTGALESSGALCEADDDGRRATALLPEALAARLSLPEACTLALDADDRAAIPCGLGSPLLEKLIAEARAVVPVESRRLEVDPPRLSHVRSLGERFALRNGVSEIGQITLGSARYAVAFVTVAVEADDRREALSRITTAADGGEPDAEVVARLDPSWPDPDARPTLDQAPEPGAARWIALRAAQVARAVAAPFLDEIARRHGRDHERIATYFAALIAEAHAPRRKVEAKAVEAKVLHLVAERDKKLRGLAERYATRVTASIAAVSTAELPAAFVAVKLRRRKESREITLRVPAGAHAVDRIACEGCGAPTARPAACDDRLHLLCEVCAPSAQGRVTCPACARRR